LKKTKYYKSLTVMAPIVGVLFGSGIAIYEVRRLHYLEAKYASTLKELSTIDIELAAFEKQPPIEKIPTVPSSTREQPQFLDVLRGYADTNHVQMVRWSNLALPPPSTGGNGDANAKPQIPNYTPIVSTIEIAGQYNSTRMFMYNLLRSPRLLNMTELKWVRGDQWPTTHLTFTLTRYVGPPVNSPDADRIAQRTAQTPGAQTLLQQASTHLHTPVLSNAKLMTPIQAGSTSTDPTSNAFSSVTKSSTAEPAASQPVGNAGTVPPQKESPIIVKRR
jgi:hypothetical protein